MSWGYVDYTYPGEREFNKQLIWLTINSGTCKIYFAMRSSDSDNWSYFGGISDSNHALVGGTTLVAKTSEAEAKSGYWTPVPDTDKLDTARLPTPIYAKYVRFYIEDVADVDIHEWKPSMRLRADEIIGGKLTVDNVQIDKIPYVDVRRGGTDTNATTIINTVASIGTDDRTMLITPTTWDINQDVTVATNIETKFQHGSYFEISAGKEVTFNGPIDAGRSHIFSTTGTVTFGSLSTQTIYPEWWGDTGDGTTDDTSAIQAAFNSMPDSSTVILSRGTHVSTGLVFAPADDCTLVCEGNIQDDTSGTALTIGDASVNRRYNIQKLKVISSSIDQSSGRVGVLVKNVQESTLDIRKVYGYNTGIEFLGADSQGCVHNEIHLGLIYDNKYSLYLTADTGGWCNENSFYGGRFSWNSSTPSYDGFKHLWIDHYATHILNSNKFYSPSFEGGKTATGGQTLHAIYCDGWGNSWYGMRFEMTGASNGGKIEFTSNSKNNVIYESYGVYAAELDFTGTQYLIDDGSTNTIWGYFASKVKGSSSGAILTLENVQSDSNNALSIIKTSNSATITTIAGDGSAKFGNIDISNDGVISQNASDAALVLESSGAHGVAINWTASSGTGGLSIYDGSASHNAYFTSSSEGMRVFDGCGTQLFRVTSNGDQRLLDTTKLYFTPASPIFYLDRTASYPYWHDGTDYKRILREGDPVADIMAAGADTQVQFNDGGNVIGADSSFTWNKTSNLLTVDNLDVTSSFIHDVGVTDGYVLTTDSNGVGTWKASSTSASPAGSDTEVQFNDSGAFGADSSFTWDKTSNYLSLPDIQIDKIPYVDARRGGTDTNATTIINTVASIDTDDRTMLVTPATWIINQDVTVATNIETKFQHGSYFEISAGKEVTFNGPIDAGRSHIFSNTGTVTFGAESGQKLYPEWWGAKRDNGVTDSTVAIQKSIDSFVRGSVLSMGNTTAASFYKITDTLTVPSQTHWSIVGAGKGGSIITQYTDNKAIFDIGGGVSWQGYWIISGLALVWDNGQAVTDTDSYAIRFVDYTSHLNGPWAATIENMSIVGGFRGIGIATTAGAEIAAWGLSIKHIVSYAMTGETIYFKSPVATGMPTNLFEDVYVSQRDITPTLPGIRVDVQSEGKMLNCAVEGAQGTAVKITNCPSFTVENMHLESGILGDAVGNHAVEVWSTNLVWTGGSITIDDVDTTTEAEIFYLYFTGVDVGGYNNALIEGVRTKIISTTSGDSYFFRSGTDEYHITLNANSILNFTDWHKPATSGTGWKNSRSIQSINGIYAKNEFLAATGTGVLINSGLSYLRPGASSSNSSHTLPDGDIINARKQIRKGGNATYKATVTITTHELGANIVREFISEDSFMELVWNGTHWNTVEEHLNDGLTISSSGAIPPNGSGVHSLNSTSGDLSMTLANADNTRTWKMLEQSVDANKSTIAVATHADGNPSSFELTDSKDYILLFWAKNCWETVRHMSGGKFIFPGTGEIGSDMDISKSEPELTLYNTDGEDGDRERQTKLIFRGKQVSSNQMTLGEIEVAHDGAVADTKGIMILRVHGGSTLDDAIVIDFAGNTGVGVANPLYKLHVDGDVVPATTNNDLGKDALRWDTYAHDLDVNGSFIYDVGVTDEYVLTTDSNGVGTWKASSTSASPAGSETEVQFNDSGVFGADSSFVWNKSSNYLSLPEIRAFDSSGLELLDDSGGLGIFIKDGGDVGIDTSSPKSALDVDGSAYIGGSTQLNIVSQPADIQLFGYNGTDYNNVLINAVDTPAIQIFLKTDGCIGFGTDEPQAFFHQQPGTTGGIIFKAREETVTIHDAASYTIAVAIPTGYKLIGVQLRVDAALNAGDTWDAEWNDGASLQSICTGVAAAQNTKVNKFHDDNANTPITDAETDIVITKNGGGAFTDNSGVIRAIAYYQILYEMADV